MFDLEQFIEDCKKAVLGDQAQTQVKTLMEDAFSDPQALHHPGPAVAPADR